MPSSCLPDYVYFETSPTSPWQIRRIEELNKTPSGNVEAKVMCFYRRRDLPNSLVQLADKHQSECLSWEGIDSAVYFEVNWGQVDEGCLVASRTRIMRNSLKFNYIDCGNQLMINIIII